MTQTKTVEDVLQELAVGMYANGRSDVVAGSDIGVTPSNLGHAEPVMQNKVKDALADLKALMEGVINTSKSVYYVKGKQAEADRYCEIREELRQEQLEALTKLFKREENV